MLFPDNDDDIALLLFDNNNTERKENIIGRRAITSNNNNDIGGAVAAAQMLETLYDTPTIRMARGETTANDVFDNVIILVRTLTRITSVAAVTEKIHSRQQQQF